jgi:hypothetical protein
MPHSHLGPLGGGLVPPPDHLGIGNQGLSVEEYDSILEVAQNDPDVREKIRQRIRPSAQ